MSGTTTERHTAVSRPLVGAIAVALLGTWAIMGLLQLTGGLDSDDSKLRMWWAGFGRVGLVMLALWLALPSPGRPAAWANLSKPMLIGLVLAIGLVAVRPWIAIPLLALLAVASLFLRPRAKRRPSRSREPSETG